jgi:hypothetical protein
MRFRHDINGQMMESHFEMGLRISSHQEALKSWLYSVRTTLSRLTRAGTVQEGNR